MKFIKLNRKERPILAILILFIVLSGSLSFIIHFNIQQEIREYDFDRPAIQYWKQLNSSNTSNILSQFQYYNDEIYSLNNVKNLQSSYIYHFDNLHNTNSNQYTTGKIIYIPDLIWTKMTNKNVTEYIYYDYNDFLSGNQSNVELLVQMENRTIELNSNQEVYSNIFQDICYCNLDNYGFYIFAPTNLLPKLHKIQNKWAYVATIYFNQQHLKQGQTVNEFKSVVSNLDIEIKNNIFENEGISQVYYPLIRELNNISQELLADKLDTMSLALTFIITIEILIFLYANYIINKAKEWHKLLFNRGFSYRNLLISSIKYYSIIPISFIVLYWFFSVLIGMSKIILHTSLIYIMTMYLSFFLYIIFLHVRKYRSYKNEVQISSTDQVQKIDSLNNHLLRILYIVLFFSIILTIREYIEYSNQNYSDFSIRLPSYFEYFAFIVSIIIIIGLFKRVFFDIDSTDSVNGNVGNISEIIIKKHIDKKALYFFIVLLLLIFNNIQFTSLSLSLQYSQNTAGAAAERNGDVLVQIRDLSTTNPLRKNISDYLKQHDSINTSYSYTSISDVKISTNNVDLFGVINIFNFEEYNQFRNAYSELKLSDKFQENYIVNKIFYDIRIKNIKNISLSLGELVVNLEESDFLKTNNDSLNFPTARSSDIYSSYKNMQWDMIKNQVNSTIDLVFVLKTTTNQKLQLQKFENSLINMFGIYSEDLRIYQMENLYEKPNINKSNILRLSFLFTSIIQSFIAYVLLFDRKLQSVISKITIRFGRLSKVIKPLNYILYIIIISNIMSLTIGLLIGITSKRNVIQSIDNFNFNFNPLFNIKDVIIELISVHIITIILLVIVHYRNLTNINNLKFL